MSEFSTLNDLVVAAQNAESQSPVVGASPTVVESPQNGLFGNQTPGQDDGAEDDRLPVSAPEGLQDHELAQRVGLGDWSPYERSTHGPGYQGTEAQINRAYQVGPKDPVDVMIVLTQSGGQQLLGPAAKPSRKNVLNDFYRGRLVALLGLGLSLRQAAAALSISHVAIIKALKRDADLRDEVHKARFQAQLEPLAKIIRESRLNWHAARWLLKYLDKHTMAEGLTLEEQEQEEEGTEC